MVGQSHFKTFDNKFFTFTSRCQYLLSRDCADNSFSVIIENVQVIWCVSSVSLLSFFLSINARDLGVLFQCADDEDAVCTRSVTLSLPSLEDMTVKLKHGGVVSVNSMDIQTPMHHGMLWEYKSCRHTMSINDKVNFLLCHFTHNKRKMATIISPTYYLLCFLSMCNFTGHLHIQRSVQSVHVKFGDDLRLDWDGRGRVLLKVGIIQICVVMVVVFYRNDICLNTGLTFLHLLSWDHNGQERPVVSVETTMVTKAMTSCLALAW